MKTTTVPAQITTVEDRFAGGLSLTQLLLLVAPVFVSCAIYLIFPPFLKISIIKVGISCFIFICFGILAIRIKGKIILVWISLVTRYRNRPRYYLFNKNDLSNRKIESEVIAEEVNIEDKNLDRGHLPQIDLTTPDLVRLETAIADPLSNFNFNIKKGILSVNITEIQ